MGFRRAKSTQGNTNCQKNIFEDDQVPGHHPRALSEMDHGRASDVSVAAHSGSTPPHPREPEDLLGNQSKNDRTIPLLTASCSQDNTLSMMLYTLNVNGLIGKFQEIQNLLVTDQPHLVCLTETKLSADVDDNLISIPGYSIVRRDRNNHGGGVAIYYKTDLKVTRSDFTELKQELVMLKLETRFVNILIGCLYRPPSAPTSFWGALDQQLEEVPGVEHPPPTLLLTGDLNVDILDTKHPHYNHLHSFLATHNLTNHVSSPTRYSSTRNSCLDLLLCQDATLVNSCASQPTTVPTDHELICTTLTLPLTPSVTTVQSETRDLRKIDIKAFCDDLRKADLDTFPPEAEQNVDAMWTSWTEKFFQSSTSMHL